MTYAFPRTEILSVFGIANPERDFKRLGAGQKNIKLKIPSVAPHTTREITCMFVAQC